MLSGGTDAVAIQAVLNESAKNNVHHFLNVSVDLETFPYVLSQAEAFENIYASVGIHPNYKVDPEPKVEELVQLADHPKVIAIGETGLDYFRSAEEDKATQQERLRRHIQAANATRKPLIIHMREAKEDTLKILQEENAQQAKGIMHCFVEDWDAAQRAMDLGFMISISGIVTFKNAKALQDVVKKIPDEYLLVETDSPYLAPMPHRGKENHPSFVKHTAQYIADLRETSLDHIAAITTRNFCNLFGLQGLDA